jgi:two-component system chemotaxis sensor kinase CheA
LKAKLELLLDNAKEGFVFFDSDMRIEPLYSKEANRIFQINIADLQIHELLYSNDIKKASFLKETLQGILKETPQRQEVLISLLQDEFVINKNNIQCEYKVLDENHFLLILTDITQTKELEQKIKDEQQVLKMVVQVVSVPEQFNEIKKDYYLLCSGIKEFQTLEMLGNLRREIHTFKGLFAQKEMLYIVKSLHEFEALIDSCIKNENLEDTFLDINTDVMVAWLEKDITILNDILGEEFFSEHNYIHVDKKRIESLYNRYKRIIKTYDNPLLENMAYEIQRLSFNDIKSFLKPYEKMVDLLAQRLEKDIEPMSVQSDDIFISDNFKPFLNSLVHVFRNCVDHGIESSDERVEKDKKVKGTITCNVTQSIDNIILSIGDDGKGLDPNLLRDKALHRGVYTKEQLSNKSDDEILYVIFEEDFSTTSSISDVSGRGIGLSSVWYEINRLGGIIEIENNFGYGVEFKFIIPKLNVKTLEIDILSKLSQRTIGYFTENLNLPLQRDVLFKEYETLEPKDINVIIELDGGIVGEIIMGVSSALAITMVNNFVKLELPQDEIEFLAAENVAETLNITLGNILKDFYLVSDSETISISTPKIIYKKDFINIAKNSYMESSISYENEVIKLWYVNNEGE